MNTHYSPFTGEPKSATKTVALLSFSLALGAAFWLASSPMAGAAAGTPAERLQSNLPPSTTLASAPKAQVLTAVCKSVSSDQKDAAEIVRTAAGARRDLTNDILSQAVRCVHGDAKDGKEGPCGLIRSMLNEAIAVDAAQTAALTEMVGRLAPNCLDTPAEGPVGVPTNVTSPPGPGGGGGITNNCTVCHNNQNILVPCENQGDYLRNHPGDTAGACQATAEVNR